MADRSAAGLAARRGSASPRPADAADRSRAASRSPRPRPRTASATPVAAAGAGGCTARRRDAKHAEVRRISANSRFTPRPAGRARQHQRLLQQLPHHGGRVHPVRPARRAVRGRLLHLPAGQDPLPLHARRSSSTSSPTAATSPSATTAPMTQDFYPLSKTPLRYLLADHIDLTSREPRQRGPRGARPHRGRHRREDRRLVDGKLTLIFDRKTYELQAVDRHRRAGAQHLGRDLQRRPPASRPDPGLFQITLPAQLSAGDRSHAPRCAGLATLLKPQSDAPSVCQSGLPTIGSAPRLAEGGPPAPALCRRRACKARERPASPGAGRFSFAPARRRLGCLRDRRHPRNSMSLTIATWNINSVRLRIGLVGDFLDAHQPDVLCLQEIKCPDDRFPCKPPSGGAATSTSWSTARRAITASPSSRAGRSRATAKRGFCGKDDARHAAVTIADGGGDIVLHNFYVPAGGDEPDPAINAEVRPQARLPRRDEGLADRRRDRPQGDPRRRPQHRAATRTTSGRTSSCCASSATRRSRPRASKSCAQAGGWVDAVRHFVPPEQKLYTWWSYRAPTGRPPIAAAGSITSG